MVPEKLIDNLPVTGGPTRRAAYMAAIYGIWATIAATLAAPASAYLLFPPRARKEELWTEVCDITALPPNQPLEMVFRRNRIDGWKIINEKMTAWVVKNPAGDIAAYSPHCTHLGCAYHWDPAGGQFVCPCHNSLFDSEGRVTAGPAPRPLDRYQTRIDGGKLLLGGLRSPV